MRGETGESGRMAEIHNFSGNHPSLEVQQIFRLIKAFLAIGDETARAHLVAIAEGLAASHDARAAGDEAGRLIAEYLRAMVNGGKRRH